MRAMFTGRIVGTAAAVLLAFGVGTRARADVVLRNVTDQPIHFTMSCDGESSNAWTIDPHASGGIYCRNGSRAAVIVLRTSHGDHVEVVRSTVWDGRRYTIGYDRDGDVNID